MLRILLLALFVCVPACEKSKDKKVSASRPTASVDLGDVVATLQLPAGDSAGEFAALIDKVQPGMSAVAGAQLPMLLGKATGVDLSAADLSKPVSLVVLNPKKHPEPIAVLVTPENLKQLKASAENAGRSVVSRDGLALVGPAAVVESAQNFVFATLAAPSKEIVGIAYPDPLSKIYSDEIGQGIAEMSKTMGAQGEGFARLLKLYQEAGTSLAQQTDRMVVRVEASNNSADILFYLYPTASSTLAAFVDAQVVADHGLLSKFPANADHGIVFSGNMRAGAARKAIVDFGVQAMATMYDREAVGSMAKLMDPWFDAFTGSVATTMAMNFDPTHPAPGMSMNYLMGASDAKAVRTGWHQMFDILSAFSGAGGKMEMLGIKTKVEVHKNIMQVDGVEVDHYHREIEMDEVTPEQRLAMEAMGADIQDMYFATFDEVAVMSTVKDGQASVQRLIAAARGKEAGFQTPAALAQVLAASTKRKESLIMYMDMKSLVPTAAAVQVPFQFMVMGMGKADGALVMRTSMGL